MFRYAWHPFWYILWIPPPPRKDLVVILFNSGRYHNADDRVLMPKVSATAGHVDQVWSPNGHLEKNVGVTIAPTTNQNGTMK